MAAAGTEDSTRLLIDAIQRLSMARTVADVQAIVRRTARGLCGADGATFVLRDGDLCHYADEDAISPLWKGQRFPLETCISGWAMLNRRPAAIPDIYVDDRIPHDAYRPTFVKSLAMVPIRRMDPIGAIGNYWASEHEPTEHELELLGALADSTAVAMESVQLWNELEAHVADRTADLTGALELNEEILATLAHEIRNALTVTVGLLELSLSDPTLGDQLRTNLSYAFDAASDGVSIVKDQLNAARRNRMDLSLKTSTVKPAELLDEVAAGYRTMLREDRVALVVDLDPKTPPLQTDEQLLTQALRNLLSNALKFTDSGEIRLSARPIGDNRVAITVADTGIGIPQDQQDRVFESWAQVDAAQGDRAQGTGLGLSFVRRVSDVLGGELALDSIPGEGAAFTLTLPLVLPGWQRTG